ncbi:MAG: hypothetical protein WCZ02_08195, partial [Lysobacterales bacterium]
MKHLALTVSLVWLAVMIWIALWLLAPTPSPLPAPASSATGTAVAQLSAAVERGRQTLEGAVRPAFDPLAGTEPVIALLPTATAAVATTAAPTGQAQADAAGRTLSMVYTGAGFQRAVIDGQYVSPGQRLVDGGRVEAIAADHVVVR